MPQKIEFHIIQSFAPSNLNRDDTGSPKDTIFGGARRARISSQSLKRAARIHMRDGGLIPETASAIRTKRLVRELANHLQQAGIDDPEVAAAAALNVLNGVDLKSKKARNSEELVTDYLVFVGQNELRDIAEIVAPQAEELANPKSKAIADVVKQVRAVLTDKGAGAIDLALFGRMLANLPDANVDASTQVAHAISTHRVDREFDYFTAVDDRQPADNAGADMIGTVEFNASTFYRYSVVDVEQLRENLGGDTDLVASAIEAYASAVVEAIPTGKQNTFAAHNPPSLVLVTIRDNQSPRNLANAFEQPVYGNRGILNESVERLAEYWEKLDGFYGTATKALVLDVTGSFTGSAQKMTGLAELASAVRAAVE